MANDRVPQALSRIEAAVDRIEARIAHGAAAPEPAMPEPAMPDAAAATGEDGLAARHERLRAGTAAALARLDRLLGADGAD